MQHTHRTLLYFILILEYVWCPFFGYLSQYHFFLIIHYHFPADVFRPRRCFFSFCMGSIIKHEKTFITHIGQIWTGLNGLNASVNWSCSGSITLLPIQFDLSDCFLCNYTAICGLHRITDPTVSVAPVYLDIPVFAGPGCLCIDQWHPTHGWRSHVFQTGLSLMVFAFHFLGMVLAVLPSFCRPIFVFGSQIKQNEDNVATVPVLPARPVARHSWMCDGVRSGFSSWRIWFQISKSWIQISEVKLPVQNTSICSSSSQHRSFERLIWRISSIRPIQPPIRWNLGGVGFDPNVQLWQLSRSPELLQLVKAWWPVTLELIWNKLKSYVPIGFHWSWWNHEIVDDILSQKLILAELWSLDYRHYLVLCVQSSSPGIGAAPQRRDPAAFWLSFGHWWHKKHQVRGEN